MRFGFLTSAGFLIFIHDPSGSAARGVLKGFILAESQPIGGFHQAGIGALDDFPGVVVRQTQHLCNQRGHHLRIRLIPSGSGLCNGVAPDHEKLVVYMMPTVLLAYPMRCKRLSYTIMVTIGSMPGQMLLQQLRCIAHQIAVTNKLQHFHIIVVIPKGNNLMKTYFHFIT